LRRRQLLDFGDVDRRQQVVACREVAVERTGSDLRAPRDLAHAGIGAATGEDLLRDFQDALAIALGVRARLAGGLGSGWLFHGTF
jgi:hypothetical protein